MSQTTKLFSSASAKTLDRAEVDAMDFETEEDEDTPKIQPKKKRAAKKGIHKYWLIGQGNLLSRVQSPRRKIWLLNLQI